MKYDKKYARQEAIKMLILSQEISNQSELMQEVKNVGYECTQGTLSRDLVQLKVMRVQNKDGRYVYVLPDSRIYRSVSDTHMTVKALHDIGVLSIKFSGNLAVVRTLPGHASHVAYDIDNAKLDCILGTVAGDDTVLIVAEEDTDRSQVMNAIAGVINYTPKKRNDE